MAQSKKKRPSPPDPAASRDGVLLALGVFLILLQVGAYYIAHISPQRDFILAALALCFGFPFAMRVLEVWSGRGRGDRGE